MSVAAFQMPFVGSTKNRCVTRGSWNGLPGRRSRGEKLYTGANRKVFGQSRPGRSGSSAPGCPAPPEYLVSIQVQPADREVPAVVEPVAEGQPVARATRCRPELVGVQGHLPDCPSERPDPGVRPAHRSPGRVTPARGRRSAGRRATRWVCMIMNSQPVYEPAAVVLVRPDRGPDRRMVVPGHVPGPGLGARAAAGRGEQARRHQRGPAMIHRLRITRIPLDARPADRPGFPHPGRGPFRRSLAFTRRRAGARRGRAIGGGTYLLSAVGQCQHLPKMPAVRAISGLATGRRGNGLSAATATGAGRAPRSSAAEARRTDVQSGQWVDRVPGAAVTIGGPRYLSIRRSRTARSGVLSGADAWGSWLPRVPRPGHPTPRGLSRI